MRTYNFSRRAFLAKGAVATAAAGTPLLWTPAALAAIPMPKAAGPLDEKLDTYIAAYMQAMNAPGLTLGLTDASQPMRTASYGFANLEAKLHLTTDHLFQIGSITKSFVALVLLQLRDEGKLDLQKPILDYLPWLPIREDFGPISVHHLLTHTSGLPDNLSLLSADPSARAIQGFKPGEHFHYCNTGFDILGELAVKLAGKPWRLCVQERIFYPLGMTHTVGVITVSSGDRSATGYQPFWQDEVYPRQGRLTPSFNLVMDDTAGCIASTPADMTLYLRMLLNHGQIPGQSKRILSEEGFTLFSTPYIKADEFSPTASYGYGVAVDTLDGHKILRHTGGMISFASSMHVDLDGGVAAFASINAMQGYRPTAVTEYSVRLLSAAHQSKPLPQSTPIPDPLTVENASQYAGSFQNAGGRKLIFTAENRQLALDDSGHKIPLQHAGGDRFLSTVPGSYATHHFIFARAAVGSSAPVVEVSYGEDWYLSPSYSGPRSFPVPEPYASYVGHYRADNPWGGETRVYIHKGQLLADGDPLTPIGGALFRAGEESWSPETAEFLYVYEGRARLLKIAGMDFWRIEVD